MKILVTGAKGMLGQDLCPILEDEGYEVLETDSKTLDITDCALVQKTVSEVKPDIIIHTAAYTNVDKAESDYIAAELLNCTAVKNLAAVMKEADGTLIHISTDYVFGGGERTTPYTEDLPTEPTSVYGLTKLHGEQGIKEIDCKYIILRTAWLYSEFGKNFVKTVMALIASRPELKVVFDQVGTPTYAGDLAAVICTIIEKRLYDANNGIYHYSNEGVCSWFDFALKIAANAGNTKCKVQPCLSHEFPSPVRRPAYSVLDKAKFKESFEINIPYWSESLQVCMNKILANNKK